MRLFSYLTTYLFYNIHLRAATNGEVHMQSNLEKLGYSVKEAVHVSSICCTNIFAAIKDNRLQVTRIGRRTIIKADSLRRLIEGGAA